MDKEKVLFEIARDHGGKRRWRKGEWESGKHPEAVGGARKRTEETRR